MLHLVIPDQELWDAVRAKFISVKGAEVDLEYSLAAISKWESKWHIPFHDDRKQKTPEQSIDIIRCMCTTPDVDPKVFEYVTEENARQVSEYISDDATATWFSDTGRKKGGKREIVTAEIIYYWMTLYNIPESYQYWHLNKLITFIRVCAEKSNPDKNKKMSSNMAAQRRALNAARKKRYHTRG